MFNGHPHGTMDVPRLVESLLRRGADVSARSNDGESALHVVPGGYAELEAQGEGRMALTIKESHGESHGITSDSWNTCWLKMAHQADRGQPCVVMCQLHCPGVTR